MELVTIGYFPKHVMPRPEWLNAPCVQEVCSVSECMSPGPAGWIDQWKHNESWVYDSPELARSVISAEEQHLFRVFAYRLYSIEFLANGERNLGPLRSASILPDGYRSLGFDIVSHSCGTSFECSPLSCNNMAAEIAANRHCLVPDLATGIVLAKRFAIEEPEPGPYLIVEVLEQPSSQIE